MGDTHIAIDKTRLVIYAGLKCIAKPAGHNLWALYRWVGLSRVHIGTHHADELEFTE